MWRTRAVISMLVEDVAGLRTEPPEPGQRDNDRAQVEMEALDKARRRAGLVVIIDWLAILILFLFRDPSRPFLPSEPTVEVVFTFGVLAVAVHSGFRAAQLLGLRNIERLCRELESREGP